MYDILIIGGGASGLATAVFASDKNMKIAVLERNNGAAKKIYATGNGHCNYVNLNGENAPLLVKKLSEIGIVPVEDDMGRLYPRNRESSSVVDALVHGCNAGSVQIICDCHITDVIKRGDVFKVLSKDGRKFEAKKLVIATGGKAGIQFGCYGEGYRWAQSFGHSLIKPVPALVPLETSYDISMLHGVRVKAKASILCNGEILASDSGEVQFTKDSISGICVMNLAKHVRLGEDKAYVLSIDLYPEYEDEASLVKLFMHQIKSSGCAMNGLVPKKMHDYLHTRIEPSMHNPKTMAHLSKNLTFEIKGTKGWSDAQVTAGGVPFDEIDMDTMESKKVPGLYFTGEILDYDGPCGGYNLTFAWNSALKAGEALRKNNA